MSTGARPEVIFCPLEDENWKIGDRKLGNRKLGENWVENWGRNTYLPIF